MNIKELIRYRLEELGHEQRDLAAAAQVTESYISNLHCRLRLYFRYMLASSFARKPDCSPSPLRASPWARLGNKVLLDLSKAQNYKSFRATA